MTRIEGRVHSDCEETGFEKPEKQCVTKEGRRDLRKAEMRQAVDPLGKGTGVSASTGHVDAPGAAETKTETPLRNGSARKIKANESGILEGREQMRLNSVSSIQQS